MTLPPFHLLGGVEATLVASHARGLDRLGVHYRGAGVRVPAEAPPQPLAQLGVQTFPCPVDAPSSEPVVDALPGREILRQQPPWAAALKHVEDGVEDSPQAVQPRTSLPCGLRKMWADAMPFIVGQIRRVSPALHGAQRRPPSRSLSTFQTVSGRGILGSS